MIVLKRLLITSICFLVFIPAFLLISSVSYSENSNLDFLLLQFACYKHPTGHFVAYYLPPTSAHINSSNYKNYEAWKGDGYFIIQPGGKVKITYNDTSSYVKMNNGHTYNNKGSLLCYAKNNKIYLPNDELALYTKNNVLYDRNNNFIASLRKLGPLTSFYNIEGAWLGLRADLSQENILTYLAFYYNFINNNDKILFTIRGINSNYYIIMGNNRYIFFLYMDGSQRVSPAIPLGYRDKHSFYDEEKQLVGRYNPQTSLITNYKGTMIGKITRSGYVYGKTNNLLGRVGKFIKYLKKNNTFIAKIYNASGKHIADLIKHYNKTD